MDQKKKKKKGFNTRIDVWTDKEAELLLKVISEYKAFVWVLSKISVRSVAYKIRVVYSGAVQQPGQQP